MTTKTNTTIDELELAKFAQHATEWWNKDGPLKTLHDINPIRMKYMFKYTEINAKHILDVGCGGGILSEALASKGAFVTGLDVEEKVIFIAKQHAKANHLKIDYVCQPIEAYQAPSFDIITCMEMLEHVVKPALIIKHCARLLKPGGFLFLSTINRTLIAYASVILAGEYILRLLPRQTHDFDKFIKVSELAAMVRSVGLDMVGVEGMSYNPLTRVAALQSSVKVNYLMVCQKL